MISGMRYLFIILIISISHASCGLLQERAKETTSHEPVVIVANGSGTGPAFRIELTPGSSFYYPLIAFWLEDMDGNYIQTLYVARSVATGIFRFGESKGNKWVEAPKRAPQTLPYWAHKRGIRASDGLYMPEPQNPVADAYTGATPVTAFILEARADSALKGSFRVLMEINQNWDWNQYWHNNRFPGDSNYAMSAQPAIVYEALIETGTGEEPVMMEPAGHSHWSGSSGELFTDISTLTTALEIAGSVKVSIKR